MLKKLIPTIIKKSFLPFLVVVLVSGAHVTHSLRFKEFLGQAVNAYIQKALLVIFILGLTFWFQSVSSAVFVWYQANIARKTQTPLDEEFVPLFRRIANIVIWVIGLVVLLGKFGVNINALIATLGVSSLAIALAAQDTIANIIAGFLIMIDRPFRLGDRVRLPSGEDVEVLDIGIRRSQFLSKEGSVIVMPNLDLSKSKIVNYTYGEERKK